jgi:hypothetical protein
MRATFPAHVVLVYFLILIISRAAWMAVLLIVTRLRAGLRLPEGARPFYFLQNAPNWLWGPTRLLFNGHRALFLQVLSDRGVKLPINIHHRV